MKFIVFSKFLYLFHDAVHTDNDGIRGDLRKFGNVGPAGILDVAIDGHKVPRWGRVLLILCTT